MTTGDGLVAANPLAAKAAPRLALVLRPGHSDETRISCRRIVTLIGSRSGCKVKLEHRKVAPVHTAIVNDGTRILAVDLITSVGTYLNGLKMEHERLGDGDILRIHTWQFRVEIEEPIPSGSADVHRMALDPSPNIVALEELATERILRPKRDVCVIGRRNGCDIAIPDAHVSRAHALLLSYFGHPAVFDLLSGNHTFVNDESIGYKVLRNDDVIAVDEFRFRIHVSGSAVGDGAVRSAKAAAENNGRKPDKPEPDLIDIHATESKQRWRIAKNVEDTTRKR